MNSPHESTPGRSRPGPATGVRPWVTVADDAIRAAGLALMVPVVCSALVPLLDQPALRHPVPMAGLVLLLLVHVSATIAVATRHRSRALLRTLYVAVPVAIILLMPQRTALVPNDLWAPGVFFLPVVIVAMLTLPRREYQRWTFAGLALLQVIESLGPPLGGWVPTRFNLLDSAFLWQPVLALYLAGDGMVQLALGREQEAERTRAALAAQQRLNAEADTRREAARVLHDHVLHALNALSRSRELVSSEQAVAECRATVDHLFRPPAADGFVQLRGLLQSDPVVLEVTDEVVGDSGQLPPAVAEGLAAAVHEALSNVRKHARAEHCRVSITSHPSQGCTVVVDDDGRGFDPSRTPGRRLGLQRSVVERLDDLGGRAEVDSRPGEGTRITLRWPSGGSEPPAPSSADDALDQRVTRELVLSVLPTIGIVTMMGLLIVPLLQPVWVGIASNLLMVVLATAMVWYLRRHPMPRWVALALVPAALAPMAANVWMIEPHHGQLYLFWTAWAAGMLVQLVVVSRPAREAVAAAAVMALTMIALPVARFGIAFTWVHYTNAVIMGGGVPLVALAGTLVARDISTQTRTQELERTGIQAATAQMHETAHVEHYWSERVTSETLPLLRGVADGRFDPADPQVRSRAAALEVSVRDELVLGPAQVELIEGLARLRTMGWQVGSSLSRDDTPEALAIARLMVVECGAPTRAGQQISISATARAVTAVAIDPSTEQLERWDDGMRQLGGRMDIDPEFTRMVVPTHG